MKQEVKAIFSLKDEKKKERGEFSVVLGKLEKSQLRAKVRKIFFELKSKDEEINKVKKIFDNYEIVDYELKDYDAPFTISFGAEYEEINDELIEIDYYLEKNDQIIKEGIKNNLTFSEICDKIFPF